MSRPCFALSVMLCCMVGPLLLIGKTQAGDNIGSSSHDPGECIVCPLAHGSLEACGGYSDFDYNHYWYSTESDPEPAEQPQPVAADPEIAAAESLEDNSSDASWQSAYEDYYADYFFTDELSDETVAAELTSAPTSEGSDVTEKVAAEPVATIDDEFGGNAESDLPAEDYFDSYDSYEPISTDSAPSSSVDQASADYQAYEEEWFSYGAETTVDVSEVTEPKLDEAYEPLVESTDEVSAGLSGTDSETTSWGDEEEWYREDYGYEPDGPNEPFSTTEQQQSEMELKTGYDSDYDYAMAVEAESVEADKAGPNSQTGSETENGGSVAEASDTAETSADYDSFYEAYDDLYNFETNESPFLEPTDSDLELLSSDVPVATDQVVAPQPAWLTDLIARMLSPIWTDDAGVALNPPLVGEQMPVALLVDECASQWDCEAGYWAPGSDVAVEQVAAEHHAQPSVVLGTANTLDQVAQFLQDAADLLRDFAEGDVVETARAKSANSSR